MGRGGKEPQGCCPRFICPGLPATRLWTGLIARIDSLRFVPNQSVETAAELGVEHRLAVSGGRSPFSVERLSTIDDVLVELRQLPLESGVRRRAAAELIAEPNEI